MRARKGYFRAGAIAGVPIHVHWSLPIGPFVLSGFRFAPGLYFGIFAVILVHELGHAAVAKVRGCAAQRIEMHALGGACYAESRTALDGIAIAWGGVLAQAWLYLAISLLLLVTTPVTQTTIDLVEVLTATNLFIAAINLLPVSSLDGAEAWKIFSALGWFSRDVATKPLGEDDDVSLKREEIETRIDDPLLEAESTVAEALARAKREARARRDSVD